MYIFILFIYNKENRPKLTILGRKILITKIAIHSTQEKKIATTLIIRYILIGTTKLDFGI